MKIDWCERGVNSTVIQELLSSPSKCPCDDLQGTTSTRSSCPSLICWHMSQQCHCAWCNSLDIEDATLIANNDSVRHCMFLSSISTRCWKAAETGLHVTESNSEGWWWWVYGNMKIWDFSEFLSKQIHFCLQMENYHPNFRNLTWLNLVVEFLFLLRFNTQVKQQLSIILTLAMERWDTLRKYFKQTHDLLVPLKPLTCFDVWHWSPKTAGT